MSLTTVSAKKNRIYQRKFDHDEALTLRAAGWSYGSLAERYGVNETAVRRVCDPSVRSRMAAHANDWIRDNKRTPCKGGCGRLVWMQNKGRSGYCQRCLRAKRADERNDVLPQTLRCFRCGAWKPDAEFGTYRPIKARRGHTSNCRACDSEIRRIHRQRKPEQQRMADRRYYVNKRRAKVQTFVVLKPNGDNAYHEIARVSAVGATHAIEQAATGAGSYIAVPTNRFTQMRVEPVQAFRVLAEPATSDGLGTIAGESSRCMPS